MALEMSGTSEALVYTTKVIHPVILNTEITNDTKNKFAIRNSWAQRLSHHKRLGHTTEHLLVLGLQT